MARRKQGQNDVACGAPKPNDEDADTEADQVDQRIQQEVGELGKLLLRYTLRSKTFAGSHDNQGNPGNEEWSNRSHLVVRGIAFPRGEVMKKGDKIKMIIESTGEIRFYQIEQLYGDTGIFRAITEQEAGEKPLVITVKNLRTKAKQ